MKIFSEFFDIECVVVKLSHSGLKFRSAFPEKWKVMIDAGLTEEDLLIKSLSVILRKMKAGFLRCTLSVVMDTLLKSCT